MACTWKDVGIWGPCAQQKGLQRRPRLGFLRPTLRWCRAAEIPGLAGAHHPLGAHLLVPSWGEGPACPVAPGSDRFLWSAVANPSFPARGWRRRVGREGRLTSMGIWKAIQR